MDFFNKLTIVMVLIIKCSALGLAMLCIGCWIIYETGIVPARSSHSPVHGLLMVALICTAIELAAAYFMSFVPVYVEPPKPIGWRPPLPEKRGPHDSPWL
jgi:hypothetical protein